MSDLIETDQPTTRNFPRHTVAVSDTLNGDWIEVPDLYCNICRFVAGPELDYATFTWNYGFKRPIGGLERGYYWPIEASGLFVRVRVEGLDTDWYGILEDDRRQLQGSRLPLRPSGRQVLTAYGLGRLLERQPITTAVAESLTIERGLPFNLPIRTGRGNRSADKTDGVYLYSDKSHNQDEWTVDDALRYLIKHHVPELTGVTWEVVVDDTRLLERPLPPTPTDRRSVKEVLDAILDRRRGIGYQIRYNPDVRAVQIACFSFADRDVLGTDDEVLIPANPLFFDLNFENALDVEAQLLYHWGSEYDRIIVEGEYATSTITVDFVNVLQRSWTGPEQDDFVNAAKSEDGYDDLDLDEKYRRNEAWRAEDRLAHVFARFEIDPDWNQRNDDDYFAFPADDDAPQYDAGPPATEGLPLWNQGLRLLPRLPFKPRLDYSGAIIINDSWNDPDVIDELQPAFVYLDAGEEAAVRYQLLDRLPPTEDDEPRGWSCHLRVHRELPQIELRVSDGRQQLIAKNDWAVASPGDTDPEHDPNLQASLDHKQCYATLCLQGDHRASATKVIRDPPDRPRRVLRIYVPGLRLDYVVPETVIGINDGNAITSDGGYVNDDRDKLQQIADLAAAWYGRQRATLSLSLRNVDTTFEVGQLIRSIGEAYDVPDLPPDATFEQSLQYVQDLQTQALVKKPVNSPVTLLEWDFVNALQRIETAYAELDFASR